MRTAQIHHIRKLRDRKKNGLHNIMSLFANNEHAIRLDKQLKLLK